MASKLRLKLGDVEIEYEGSEDFLKAELPELLKTAMELFKVADSGKRAFRDPGGRGGSSEGGATEIPTLTTGSIAAKLSVDSGGALLLAAAARLGLVDGKPTFTRQQLLEEMKSATAYYNKNYSSNLSKLLKTALKDDRLSETAKNVFALTASARSDLERRLADN